MKYLLVTLYLCSFAIIPSLFGQYTVNGNAFRENCNCYTLTQNFNNQSGSVWNNNRINLTQSFAFTFDVFLGCNDGGADGIAFVLQPISTSVGSSGGGMGYVGISPAVGVTLDTYQNASPDNDPLYDHIAIQLNGDVNHASANTLTSPTAISALSSDVEDCQTHFLKVVWDAPTTTMTVYFDGIQRVTVTRDFVNTVFAGNTQVFWGFTGATGGLSNLQRFCTSLVPRFNLLPTQNRCIGEPITFNDSTVTFGGILKRYWNFGDGSPIDSVNVNPTHTYTTAGDYNVSLNILALDSCTAVFNQTVRVGSKPVAFFKLAANSSNYCEGSAVQFTDSSYSTIGTINNWYWDFGNGQTSTVSNPSMVYNIGGDFLVKLLVKSVEGCVSDTFYKTIHIYGRPIVDYNFTDSVCLGTATNFFGSVISSSDPVTDWRWIFGDTSTVITNTQNASYTFSTPGIHSVVFMATSNGSGGCMGIKTKSVFVADKPKAAIKIITGCENRQVQLMDSSYTTDGFSITGWWWDLGNGQFSSQQNPLATYTTAGPKTIRLVVRNNRNCISDTLNTTINIGAKPLAKFGIGEALCNNSSV
ncbi:MAG TPA: PKD domain-containing protein, partial [Ferruginibacter sp.]|nr:PKD domain-containing protein [Ferruginibacter sp.]